jgi:hypothetical protein
MQIGDLVRYHEYFGIIITPSKDFKGSFIVTLGNGLTVTAEPGEVNPMKLPKSSAVHNFREIVRKFPS